MSTSRQRELEKQLLALYRQHVSVQAIARQGRDTLRFGDEMPRSCLSEIIMLENELACVKAEETPMPGDRRWLSAPGRPSARRGVSPAWGYGLAPKITTKDGGDVDG